MAYKIIGKFSNTVYESQINLNLVLKVHNKFVKKHKFSNIYFIPADAELKGE